MSHASTEEPAITIRRDVLESWLKVSGYTRSRLARDLRVSKGRISQVLNADQEPSARLIAGLLHVTHLPFDRLFTLKTRKALLRRLQQLSQQRRQPLSVAADAAVR